MTPIAEASLVIVGAVFVAFILFIAWSFLQPKPKQRPPTPIEAAAITLEQIRPILSAHGVELYERDGRTVWLLAEDPTHAYCVLFKRRNPVDTQIAVQVPILGPGMRAQAAVITQNIADALERLASK